MGDERDSLIRELPVPASWSKPEVVGDHVDIAGVRVHRAGVCSRNESGVEVTGSAAEQGGSPLRRAWLELLERMAVVDAGVAASDDPRRRPSRSNGVAAHATWPQACESARLELIERDRVLRSWFGEIAPEPVGAPQVLRDVHSHEWQACVVPGGPWGGVEAAIVVGFPFEPEMPLARGFAARATRNAAVEAAGREALQTLAFLWGEPLPDGAPDPAPTPMYHLDYYLCSRHHHALRRWLGGEHVRYQRLAAPPPATADVRFVDLTPPTLRGQLYVAQALSEGACPLEFGEPPPWIATSLPRELHVHPIA